MGHRPDARRKHVAHGIGLYHHIRRLTPGRPAKTKDNGSIQLAPDPKSPRGHNADHDWRGKGLADLRARAVRVRMRMSVKRKGR